jgi:hypothetical protein
VVQFNSTTTPIIATFDSNNTIIINVDDANLPTGTYDIEVSFTNIECGRYTNTRRITVEDGSGEGDGSGNLLVLN